MRRMMTAFGTLGLIAGVGVPAVSVYSPAQAYPSTERIELQVTGRAGVPSNASAVVMNVTATNVQAAGFVVVWPCGQPFPEASNLNFNAGQDIPNLVISRIGAGGKVCLEASANTDLIADVAGYFPAGSDYTPTASPVRILDTRATAPVTADAPLRVGVAGRAGVPGDALAVVMNVTATGAADPGYVTVYPCTPTPPDASNLNYVSGQDIPNLVIARINASGEVCMFSSTAVNLIADVAGYFPAGSDYTPTVSPVRILDTRSGLGAPQQPVAAGTTIELQVGGNGGVPGDASAVVMNVTVSAGPNPGYVTVFPCGRNLPEASNLNYAGDQAIPNLVIARLGVAGRVCLFTSADADLIADVAGYFPAGSDYTPTATPVRILDTRSIPAPTPPPAAPAPPPATPTPPPATTAPPASSLTPSQQQAVKKAESYLSFTSFSRQGLIDQLVFEKFSVGDATIAVDSLNVDWNAQAVKKAESYLSVTSFSRQGLIDQLVFEDFTTAQATFGVDSINVDWNAQAVKKAESYLEIMAFSCQGLIDQLVFEKFTNAQATHGANQTGIC